MNSKEKLVELANDLAFVHIDHTAFLCHKIAKEKGFWKDRDPDNVLHGLAELALIHSEVSEAAEALRRGDEENFKEELADSVIRIFDTAAARRITIGHEIMLKMLKNIDREHMHGKKA